MEFLQKLIDSSDAQFENIALCKILISKKLTPELLPEYFTGSRQQFFEEIYQQWTVNKCIDPVILKTNFYENVTEALKESGSDSRAIINKLEELWKRRELAKTIHNCGTIESIDDILYKIQAETALIALKTSKDIYNHHKTLNDVLTALERAQTKQAKIAGYSTGIIELDKYLNGIEKGKFYCIGALKKTGKSRFAIYLSIMAKNNGAGVMWNSLEMNESQLNSLALSYYSGIDSRNFGRYMTKDEFTKIAEGFNDLNNLNWTIYRERTIQLLRARILQEKNSRDIDVVIVDFIQRMCDDSKESRTKEVEKIAMELADMSRELNVAVVALSQLSGLAERLGDDEMPNMSHMKESQGIAENADAIITLHNYDRRKNPFNDDGSYRLQEMFCLIEQRYDVSGCCFKFLGDMRNCHFVNHTEPYGERTKI